MKIKPNLSKRTFTIYKNGSKFRTCKMLKHEFEDNLNNTLNDWQNFLKNSNNYFLVK